MHSTNRGKQAQKQIACGNEHHIMYSLIFYTWDYIHIVYTLYFEKAAPFLRIFWKSKVLFIDDCATQWLILAWAHSGIFTKRTFSLVEVMPHTRICDRFSHAKTQLWKVQQWGFNGARFSCTAQLVFRSLSHWRFEPEDVLSKSNQKKYWIWPKST